MLVFHPTRPFRRPECLVPTPDIFVDVKVQIRRRNIPEDELLADLRQVVADNALDALTRKTYDHLGEFNSSAFCKRFGSWAHACDRAGVATGISPARGQDDHVWMLNLFETWLSLGRQPTYGDMAREPSRFGPTGYARRYGSWTAALELFQSWIDRQEGVEEGALPETVTRPRDGATPRSPNLRTRWRVLERDRFTCVACGSSPATTPGTVLHVDHVIPYSKHGPTELENLQTLCDRCNLGKSDQTSAGYAPGG